MATKTVKQISEPTNGGATTIAMSEPYVATVKIRGTCDMLLHRWNCEAVDAKSKAAKGSAAKKTDDVESYVYRNDAGEICIPGEYVRGAILAAAKYKQDPRSARKNATDLFKAGVSVLTPLASTGLKAWDYEDRRRVCIQRAAITRVRPALRAGWEAGFQFLSLTPEYVTPDLLHEMLSTAGRLIGVGDFRPTFGRFSVIGFETGLYE